MMLVDIGTDLSVCGSADPLASWAALCPGNHASVGTRKTGKTRKGNHALRYLWCEAAKAATPTRRAWRDQDQSLVPRQGHKQALIAVAPTMIRPIFMLFTRCEA